MESNLLANKGPALINKRGTLMDTIINEKVEPNTGLRPEVNRAEANRVSTSRPGWLDRFEEWISFLRDVVKILAE
jgi:hypothetical protein